MIPNLGLVLETIERALTVAVLPAAGNASAKEEAALGALATRWLRDVVDHVADAERASHRDCRVALDDVVKVVAGATSPALADFLDAARRSSSEHPDGIAGVREETRVLKSLVTRSLRAARADGDASRARAIRMRLAALAEREIERERAFTRATGLDPDVASIQPLAEVTRRSE